MIVGPATAGTFELLDMLSHEKADVAWMIMREVRLPRTLLAMLIVTKGSVVAPFIYTLF